MWAVYLNSRALCGKCTHQIREVHARSLFDEMPQRNLFTLNARLSSSLKSGQPQETWALFHRMHRSSIELSSYTFTPVLGACSFLLDISRGKQTHALMVKNGTDSEPVTKTALMDFYSKCGHVDESVMAFAEIGEKDVVAWNALLSNFLKNGLAWRVIGVLGEMKREGVRFSEFTLCSVLKACALLKGLRQGKQVHGLVMVMGRDMTVLGTALIDFYCDVGFVDEALNVYRQLGSLGDDVMRNSVVAGCVRNRKYKDAFCVMAKMSPNAVALTSALAACSENSDLWIGRQIHGRAVRFEFLYDTQLCNVLLDMYAKCGRIASARFLFDRIDQKTVVSWTSIIDAYGSHGYGLEALELFNGMGKAGNGVVPNAVTFLAVLSACRHSGLVEQGRECFNTVEQKFGLIPGPEHYACFIDILGRSGNMDEVWRLFNDMVKDGIKPTAMVWVALVNACKINMDVSRCEYAAKHLLELEPDNPGYYIMLSNLYAELGKWDSADELRETMRENGLGKHMGSSWVSLNLNHQ
ncbi:unnamed protein product [Rhodiola kirilowii]